MLGSNPFNQRSGDHTRQQDKYDKLDKGMSNACKRI